MSEYICHHTCVWLSQIPISFSLPFSSRYSLSSLSLSHDFSSRLGEIDLFFVSDAVMHSQRTYFLSSLCTGESYGVSHKQIIWLFTLGNNIIQVINTRGGLIEPPNCFLQPLQNIFYMSAGKVL